MVQSYTVDQVSPETRDWNSQRGGANRAFTVTFKEHPGKGVEWSRKINKDGSVKPPEVGEQVRGEIDWDGKFGPRFTKEYTQNGGGGGFYKPRDPKDTAAIQRQSCQKVAVPLLRLAADMGVVQVPKTPEDLLKLHARFTDALQRDIQRGVNLDLYGSKQEPQRKDVERVGGSDIPADFPPPQQPVADTEEIPF